jgi:hypothetical protein
MLVSLAVGFALITVAGFFEAYRAALWRDWKRLWRMVAFAIPLAGMSAITLWAGIRYPAVISRRNAGFGPDWGCEYFGKGVEICFRHPPPALQTDPPPTARVDGSQAPP